MATELGTAYHETGYRLTSNAYVQPDVSIAHAEQTVSKYLGGAPAIAIEVVSRSNTALEMETKTDLYFEFGAREVWRVYPRNRHIVVHVPESARVIREDLAVTTPLLPGFSLPVSEILAG